MKKSVLVIEKDAEQLERLKKIVLEIGNNVDIYAAASVLAAYKIIMEKTIDVFLVDVVLDHDSPGDVGGIRVVQNLRKIPKYVFTPVIFVSDLGDPTLYAYTDLNCIGYIEKPFENTEMAKKIEMALQYTTEREKNLSLLFRKDEVLYPVRLGEVVYMESMECMMQIHFLNDSVLEIPDKTCTHILEDEDISGRLIQCSRSVLVNKEFIKSIDLTNQILLLKDDKGTITIGGSYQRNVLAEF